jgi:putative NIF3 family GTP cyclohydrolase 1 type 2
MHLTQILGYLDVLYHRENADFYGTTLPYEKEVGRILMVYDEKVLKNTGALKTEPDLIISHHPLQDKSFGYYLWANEITFAWYHLVMDAHETIGHNRLLLDIIKEKVPLKNEGRFGTASNGNSKEILVGYESYLKKPVRTDKIAGYLKNRLGIPGSVERYYNGDVCKKIGVVSGGCNFKEIQEAKSEGLDTLVVGEVDWDDIRWRLISMTNIRESGKMGELDILDVIRGYAELNLIPLGHQETEILGFQPLIKDLSRAFPDVEMQLIIDGNDRAPSYLI